MKIAEFEFPDDLYYDKEHGWARLDGDTVVQGMTSYGQSIAGEIIYAEVPRAGRDVEQGKPFMSMESDTYNNININGVGGPTGVHFDGPMNIWPDVTVFISVFYSIN